MSDQLKSVRHPSVLFQAIDLQLILLSCQDSNLDKQDQNLLCYHYTTRQFRTAKIVNFPKTKKYRLNASSIDGYGRPDYSEKELEEVEIATNRMIMYVDNVDYEGLNVRSLKNNEVVEILPIGSVIKVIKILDGRAYLGECKYVYSIYLSKKQPKLKTVTGADEEGLNVRKKRNTKKSNEPIACLKNGTKVKVYGIRFGWSKISPDSEAWVISKYLK